MASGNFYTGGVNVQAMPIAQPFSGNFGWDTPIADIAASNAAAAAAQHAASGGQSHAAPPPVAAPPASSKNPPKGDVSGANAKGQAGYWLPGDATHPPKFVPDAAGSTSTAAKSSTAATPTGGPGAQAQPTGQPSGQTGSTDIGAATPGAQNIPGNDHAATIGGTPVSLSDWAIQHLIDHHNDTSAPGGSPASEQTGGAGAK